MIAAGAAAAAPRDWMTSLGLSGKDPDADLAAARSAWEAGNLTEANDRAALVAGTLSIAAEAGRGRAIVIGGGATLVLLLLLVLLIVAIVRWRGRSRRSPVVAVPVASFDSPTSFDPPTSIDTATSPDSATSLESPPPPAPPFDPGDHPA